jgi:hypothetical protein
VSRAVGYVPPTATFAMNPGRFYPAHGLLR